jgi:hypothetical protein
MRGGNAGLQAEMQLRKKRYDHLPNGTRIYKGAGSKG